MPSKLILNSVAIFLLACACTKNDSTSKSDPSSGGKPGQNGNSGSINTPAPKPSLKDSLPKVTSKMTGRSFILYPIKTKTYGYDDTGYLDPAMRVWWWPDESRAVYSSAKSWCEGQGGRIADEDDFKDLNEYLGHAMAGDENDKIIFPRMSKPAWVSSRGHDCGTGNYYYQCHRYKMASENETIQFANAREDAPAQVVCVLDKGKNPPMGENKTRLEAWIKDARNSDKPKGQALPWSGAEFQSEEFSNCKVTFNYKQNNMGHLTDVDITNPCGKDMHFKCENLNCFNENGDQWILISDVRFQIATKADTLFNYFRP